MTDWEIARPADVGHLDWRRCSGRDRGRRADFRRGDIQDRGRLDHTRALQAALDAAWSTNRDPFVPADLSRVRGLRLLGGQAERNRAFRFYGQRTGDLFARAEGGGTIIKAIHGGSVLSNEQALPSTGYGNQEIAFIRFEGNSDDPIVDLATPYTQSELHYCGIFQAGRGDGLRVAMAATGEIHY